MLNLLVLQRRSHVSATPFSRSVHARITEALDWLSDQGRLRWQAVDEMTAGPDDLDGCSALILNKHLSPQSLALSEAARRKGLLVIYDLDDWMLGFPDYSGAVIDSGRKELFRRHVDTASHVTVANSRLMTLMAEFRQDIQLVPNGFNLDKYGAVSAAPADAKTVVFSNADQLKLRRFRADFLSVLTGFFARHPEMTLDFYGDPFPEMADLPFLRYQGSLSYEEHKRRLAAGGYAFAIVPMSGREDPEDMAFNGCKNPFKYLEYGGLCIPGIFSRALIFEDVVQPGQSGCLIENTPEAWTEALEYMAGNPAFRRRMAQTARQDVLDHHHIRYTAEALWGILSPGSP